MGELKVKLTSRTEKLFREMAMKRFGYAKGSLSRAAEQAFSAWAQRREEMAPFTKDIGDPVLAIRGMLKGVRASSVELQHEASEIRARKHAPH